ncbi:MAG: LamG domain-containing protein, partial [Planctomycetota bacterium]
PDGLVLSWAPGKKAGTTNGHDVYFGTAYTDVEDAITTTPVIYKGRQDSNEYPEVGSLAVDLGVTYYWRIDEVNETNEPDDIWTGKVWSFTIEDGNASEPSPPNGVKGVNPNMVLSWTPACIADSHNVYLGTVYSDVLNGTGGTFQESPVDPNYDPGGLDPFTTYYWRIEEVDGGDTYAGQVWSFKTGKGGILVYFDFDGSEDANLPATIWDNTGSVEFTKYIDDEDPGTAKYGPANPFYNVTGTSAGFTPEAGLVRDDPCDPSESDILRLDGMAYTIEMWIKVDSIPYDDTALIKKHSAWAVGMDDDHIEFRHRDNPLDGDQQLALGEWTHVATVFDLSLPSDQKKIYINGVLDDAEGADEANPADNNDPVSICFMRRANGSSDDYLDGQIDELAILDIPLGPGTFLFYPGFEWASEPNPYNGQRRVDPNLVLTWAPGIYANSHDVYLGTDYNDVKDGVTAVYRGNHGPNEFDPCGPGVPLELGQTYYWRVDEIGDSNTWKGLVWHFRTQSLLEDPNLRVWYKFDETEGGAVSDSSGREYNSYDGSADDQWLPEGGRFDGALECDDDIGLDIVGEMLETINKGITVSVWLKDCYWAGHDNVIFDAGEGGGSAAYRVQAFVPNGDGLIEWRAGNDSNDVIQWDMKRLGLNPATLEGWHHWAFVKNETDGQREVSIYFDGELADSNATVDDTLSNIQDAPSSVGAVTWHSADLVGIIDDFRVYDSALTEADVVKLFRGGEAELAWAPDPPDGATEVAWDVNLVWKPGDYTVDHKVYFGDDWDDVNDMTEPCATPALDNELYDPGQLELGQTYYWRVDEVNEPNTYKGRIWSFTVAEFVILDDFERYDSGDHRIYYAWYDQRSQDYPEATGSWLGLATPPTYPVHIGDKAMSYQFDNDDPWADLNYSEAWLPLDEIGGFQDWTSVDVRLLTVFFYGDADNDTNSTEQMYMGVMDTDGLYGEMRYGDDEGEDMNDLLVEEW